MKETIKKTLIVVGLVLGVSISGTGVVSGEEYPGRPLVLTVTYGAGGATDFQARIVTMTAGNENLLGQPIVIVNKPGGGGRKGWTWFATRAETDGYDLASYNLPHFIAQSIKYKTKYNIDNLEPIANWGADPAVLIVPKDSPFNSIQEYVDFAKANPGKVTVSGAGNYTGHHIAMLQLQKAADIKLQFVPSGGGVAALKQVMGGQVTSGFNNLSDAYRSRERIKIIGVADVKRNEAYLPDVPTFREFDIDVDDSSVNFRGVMVRKGTSSEIIAMLSEKLPKIFEHPRSVSKMDAGGSPMLVLTRSEVQSMWKKRQAYLENLLKDIAE